ncbi:hypothetical protein Cgig2_003670 [Carnegiea gigantea]|uniref:Reverse transcriptase n=1 Tax=Carnegiea gigantea TaxID=171969 RepID=A0A9Q1GMC2_9CARY|nr:hypothetical protein Cgig2_003670 [Carnegiea gigantea]
MGIELKDLMQWDRTNLNIDVIRQGAVLSQTRKLDMCMPFTEKEIRDALFSTPNVKSPGPNGFSSGFFKSTWHMTWLLICEAIQEFFKTGEMPAFISATKLMVLPKADPTTLHHIMAALQVFHDCFGLTANLYKSQIVMGGCSPELRAHCLCITGFSTSKFPIRYLGVPITASRLSKIECQGLIDKITTRIRGWTSRNLSFAGKTVLINTAEENDQHLFFECEYAWTVWNDLQRWWPISISSNIQQNYIKGLQKYRGAKAKKSITYLVFTATIYHIWKMRNETIF